MLVNNKKIIYFCKYNIHVLDVRHVSRLQYICDTQVNGVTVICFSFVTSRLCTGGTQASTSASVLISVTTTSFI